MRRLDQISVAEGEAAIAATAIHNSLPHRPMERFPKPVAAVSELRRR